MIRKATVIDVKSIHRLLKTYSDKGELLPRAFSALYDHVRDFAVYEHPDEKRVVGCCALQICWEDLAEIRSLAVEEACQHQGIGSALLEFAVYEARIFGIREVFTLTYRPAFFELHGFAITEKSRLPQKIWADCLNCVKFPDCDELAMSRLLQ